MATELAKAYVQIIPTTKGVKQNLEEELGGISEKAGKSSGEKAGGGFLDSMGGAIVKGATALGATAATAIAGVAASAVKAYADYEQLVGGVDTLFGVSSATVQKNAAAAFQTAGLSANEYMETVTSFSAALLQGLGGDTEKAASAADVAIRDMADNANKMGTAMDSIQTAYQGFAKQNYTMLDNLKLGYGGTKSEMERLLADAQKLSGVQYDIENLSDVYEAIHVVQTELGITGTTALEASSTISGSAASMAAAWKNMLVGVADDGADFDALVGGLVESVGTLLDNLMPRIQVALSGAANLITSLAPIMAEALPGMIDEFLPNLLDAALSLMTSVVAVLPDLVTTMINALVGFLVDAIPQLISTGVELITSLVASMPEIITTIVSALPQLIASIVTAVLDGIPLLIDAGINLITSLITNLPEIITAIVAAIPQIVTSITAKIGELVPQIVNAGVNLLTSLVTNLPTIINAIVPAIPQIVAALVNANTQNLPVIINAGIQLFTALITALPQIVVTIARAVPQIITGIVQGLVAAWPQIKQAGINLFAQLKNGVLANVSQLAQLGVQAYNKIKLAFDNIKSRIQDIGKNIVDGVWSGISGAWSTFYNKVSGFFSNIVNGVKQTLGIHSPSKVFASLGRFSAEGFGVGFGNEIEDVRRGIDRDVAGIVSDVGAANMSVTASVRPAQMQDINSVTGMIGRLTDAIAGAGRDQQIHVYLDSREIRAGQNRLARALG